MSIQGLGANQLYTPVRHGTVHNGKKGDGTFETLVTKDENSKTTAKAVTYDDGTSLSVTKVVNNEDGSFTVTKTVIGPDGKTRTKELTGTRNEDGSKSFTGTVTRKDGTAYNFEGSKSKSEDGVTRTTTLTNDAGETATRTSTVTKEGNVRTVHAEGTRFNGKEYSNDIVWTVDTEA